MEGFHCLLNILSQIKHNLSIEYKHKLITKKEVIVMNENWNQENIGDTPKVMPEVSPEVSPEVTPVVPPVETAPKVESYRQPQQKVYETYKFSKAEQKAPMPPKKKGGTGRKFAICIALAVVFGLVAGAVFQGVMAFSIYRYTTTTETTVSELPMTELPNAAVGGNNSQQQLVQNTGGGSVAEVAYNVMPSVVAISNISVQEVQSFMGRRELESESSGSGIIVGQNDEELLIATNNHVIAGATTITVTFIDNSSVEAQVKGTEPASDLAVVAVRVSDIQEVTLADIKVATIGDSEELVVGEQVVAIGNALGYGQSVTAGVISALDREVTVEDVTANLIQTDTAINPGNSGGALLNMRGELIGINAVKFAANGVEGMGYAIPVSTAEPILGELMNRTTRFKVDVEKAAYLGISCRNVTPESAEMYDMPVGVFVAEVTSEAAADRAGIQKGDIITKFDDTVIKTYNELVDSLGYYEAGETINVVIERVEAGIYTEQTIPVVLDARPTDLEEQ